MKVLYITPKINNEGGVARVLAVKTNYLIEHFGFTVHIVTQNDGNANPFYDYNPKIQLHDITLKGSGLAFLYHYKKQIEHTIASINPDVVVLSDFGWKAFLFPFLIKTTIPVLFEAHASKYNEPLEYSPNGYNQVAHQFKYFFRNYSISKFDDFIVLSEEALAEWGNTKKGIVIPNPVWITSANAAPLDSKTVIVAARYSYEKGLDRLLHVWQQVISSHPDWILEIYGKTELGLPLESLAQQLNITQSVRFLPPTKNIEEKYLQASIYAMTSRSEAFPMVLIEAMSCGLPVVAYDCPVGPRSLIQDHQNGFLIKEGDTQAFAQQLMALMDDKAVRLQVGKQAQKVKERYTLATVMQQWHELFLQYSKQS